MPSPPESAPENPFRPGAGHMPPYLAGRTKEMGRFHALLAQRPVMENVVLTGLRGVGKTVLLEKLRPSAMNSGWAWVGTDLSESASVDEAALALRIMADLAVVTATWTIGTNQGFGFARQTTASSRYLDFATLQAVYSHAPGLVSDKLKAVLDVVWACAQRHSCEGVIFAYDEAQNLGDRSDKDQYPLSLLLDVFQSVQKKNMMFMLVLTGLPTLFPNLVAARTYAERMFSVINLERLGETASREAIETPTKETSITFSPRSVKEIVDISAGYPYFIQFLCRQVFDIWLLQRREGKPPASIPTAELLRKLDTDFFAGRWARVTDRQRDILNLIAKLDSAEAEFTVQQIVDGSAQLPKPFGASHVNQLLNQLAKAGLVYRNRHGRYSLAVPLLNRFILRQQAARPPTLFE